MATIAKPKENGQKAGPKPTPRPTPQTGPGVISTDQPELPTYNYRTIWLSDIHLGTPGCKAEFLAEFLKRNNCETLYLVGDIIDGWKLKSSWYWPQEHTNVVRKILTKAKRDTKVLYVTGNHDEFLRKFVDYRLEIGNIQLVNEVVHETADGRKLLILHGDYFDVITRYHRWIALAGDIAYETLMHSNYWFNKVRQLAGLRYWSLSAFAKQKVKNAVSIVSSFEEAVARECKRRGLDGVVCGHIHHAEIRDIQGVTYHNCGDWVESCTALAEDFNGKISVIRWVEIDHLNERPTVVPLVRPAVAKAA